MSYSSVCILSVHNTLTYAHAHARASDGTLHTNLNMYLPSGVEN
jgi:hypothetical protein